MMWSELAENKKYDSEGETTVLKIALLGTGLSVMSVVFAGACFAETTTEARGELAHRIKMVHDRFATGNTPAFTDAFILADVILDPAYPRRFDNFSGDISGRYIGALAMMPDARLNPKLKGLVKRLMTYQHPDGRFGNADLSFAAADIEGQQMALLWGNGRLLVGLMEYYATDPDPAVLASATRLGDFLVGVRKTCSEPEVIKRLTGKAAMGFICFTQLNEGLHLLWDATKDDRYLEAAKGIIPLLEVRGKQHSHGYFTTLRGHVSFYEATGDAVFLEAAEKAYADFVASPDLMFYGGVSEYFGRVNGTDEGCSEADFLRLSLTLWRATGKRDYLERAERLLLNQFYANQFSYGDFGHKVYADYGMAPSPGIARAWWCCTMHGLRAFRDVIDAVVTLDDGVARVNLFLDAAWTDGDLGLELSRPAAVEGPGKAPSYRIAVTKASGKKRAVAIRRPAWVESMALTVNGEQAAPAESDGYLVLNRTWKKGDVVEVRFAYAARCVTRDGRVHAVKDLTGDTITAAFMYGPWIMGVDGVRETLYFGEPWTYNILHTASARAAAPAKEDVGDLLSVNDAHQVFTYIHSGFPDPATVTLRPMAEQARHEPGTHAMWLKFQK
jgi:DUF1680 family protein